MNWNRLLVYAIYDLAVATLFAWITGSMTVQAILFFALAIGSGYIFCAFYTMKELRDEHKEAVEEMRKALDELKDKR